MVAYHPNDSWNPFSLVLKTGLACSKDSWFTDHEFPVRSHALMSFRWGLRVPVEDLDSMDATINFKKLHFLVMNKIGIEHVYESPLA
ncbi:hypothetical protein LINPERHAP2_LOCUS33542 [Linum perenne]